MTTNSPNADFVVVAECAQGQVPLAKQFEPEWIEFAEFPGFRFVSHRYIVSYNQPGDGWKLTEASTGCAVFSGCAVSRQEAIARGLTLLLAKGKRRLQSRCKAVLKGKPSQA